MRIIKHKKIFGVIFALVVFLAFAGGTFCLAQSDLEVTYPIIGGVPVPVTTKTLLPDYINYIFNFTILIAGLVAFAALIAGGYKHLTSGGNPSKIADGRDQMTSAIIGLAILLASVLILNTINPQLTTIQVNEIKSAKAIELYELPSLGGDVHYYNFGQSMANLNFDVRSIKIADGVSLDDIEIYVYPQANFEPLGLGQRVTSRVTDDVIAAYGFNPRSIDIIQKLPGVYLCRAIDCKDCLPPKTGDVSDFSAEDIDKKVKSICFRNEIKDGKTYPIRAILHSEKNFEGLADIILDDAGIPDLSVPGLQVGIWGSSLTVMSLNPDPVLDGDGKVTLCVNHKCDEEDFGTGTPYSGEYVYYGYNDTTGKGLNNPLLAEGKEVGKYDDDLHNPAHPWDGGAPKNIEDSVIGYGVSAIKVDGNYLVVVSTGAIPWVLVPPRVKVFRNGGSETTYDFTEWGFNNWVSSIRVFKLK